MLQNKTNKSLISKIQPVARSGIHKSLTSEATLDTKHKTSNLSIQAKLTIGQPNDEYEKEADSVADKVMRMPENINIQRACTSCRKEELQMKPLVQAKELKSTGTFQKKSWIQKQSEEEELQKKSMIQKSERTSNTSSTLSNKLSSTKGQGAPLPTNTRSFMENRFGSDFNSVKIHTDNEATRISKDIGAQAFTYGNDIYFNQGKYSPESSSGRYLLAHELTHTLQQNSRQTIAGEEMVFRHVGVGTDLNSPRFRGNALFEDVLDNDEVIEYGDTGSEVRRIQQCLIDLGYLFPTFGADGIFEDETKAAVISFQSDHSGLDVDGKVGFRTLGVLDSLFPGFTLPANRTDPWDMNTVLQILCPWNSHLVNDVLPTHTIVTFNPGERTRPTQTWDGSTWVNGTFISGGFHNGSTIGIENTSSERMAYVLYHEGWHAMQPSALDTTQEREFDSYVNSEQWSIDVGIPGSTFDNTATGATEDLRTTDAQGNTIVDTTSARTLVTQNYGVSAIQGEQILGRVGANQVRVQVGTDIRIRDAQIGDRVMGPANMPPTVHTINPTLWHCP